MVAFRPRPKLLAIVGLTASGKSDLAMQVARTYNGEIICADSRTVYRNMDIGTAKPSVADRKEIPHWGLDLVEPGQRFTAYQFKKYAKSKIEDIQTRGKLSILVGGTGLYIDAVLFDFGFLSDADPRKRTELELLPIEKLQEIIRKKGYQMPANSQNQRHLIRTIETKGQSSTKKPPLPEGELLIGILPSDDILRDRINIRAEQIFAGSILEETGKLLDEYGNEALERSGGIVYRICLRLINGEIDLEEAKKLDKTAEWQYARRQRTWFKRNPYIKWFGDNKQALRYVIDQLNT